MNSLTPITAQGSATESRFVVEGMHCAGCINRIEAGLARLAGVVQARVNFGAKQVRVVHLAEVDDGAITAAIEGLGFRAHLAGGAAAPAGHDESRRLMMAMAVAGFAAMNVMLLSVSIWAGAEGSTRDLFHWLSALIALPAIAYAGQPFFRSAWGALRHGHTNMDVPISIGVVLTAAMSLYETAIHGPHAYFDGAVMLLFFLLAGRFLDSAMRARAEDGVAALLRRVPADALVLRADGGTERRLVAEIAPGMQVLVAAGERVGVDGIVVAGAGHVDRALVSGESTPERVGAGATVLAGTVCLDAPLTVKVTAVGEDTVIADIARLMESAGQGKSRYVRIADRAARLYAPAVHSLAALTVIGWLFAGAGLHAAITAGVAVLIITCPCALGLAVPIAQVVAAGTLMRAGVLTKDGSALERLAEADTALLDKTGTVTLARLAPIAGLPGDPLERAALAALARASRHPHARAIAEALADTTPAVLTEISEHAGQGIEGRLGEETVRLGNPDWVGARTMSADIVTTFRLGAQAPRLIHLADALRPDAAAAMAQLGKLGLAPMLVSGDRQPPVAALARALGITGVAGMSPADKFALIERLERHGKRVLMVGDGLNDGPALRRAHVAMAPATASDVGQRAADLVFLGDRLGAVPTAIIAARRTMAVVQQNFVLAIGYNVLAVPLAMAGLVTPLIAALAMSGSSVLVVANALRLRGAAR
ncbi:heavy metal translocating P-type ATPase [Sphingomonas sp.]|uniref:heavy metal translocating P-type ATPase n=1 Tax=Sphingomonas sp. TaxID=28214 RepID=UPI001DD94097|nr:heavy metal translocating P-type ATPase [Sphingomonas sp.]MBX9796705.1 cadmium-translocating P-type ATPase [Sphingomonas sp.]